MEDSEIKQDEQPVEGVQEEGTPPTRSVKNFWTRLDEVFNLSMQNAEMKEKFDELLEQFPDRERINGDAKSYVFQPERISLSSNNDINPNTAVNTITASSAGHQVGETFSSFRIRLAKSLVNVKSIQLLSAVIPNATTNIPDNALIFFYYRLRTLAAANQGLWQTGTVYTPGDIVTYNGNTYVVNTRDVAGLSPFPDANPSYQLIDLTGVPTNRPNYFDLHWYNLQVVFINPTLGYPFEETGDLLLYNRTFQDYPDLARTLNFCAGAALNATIPDDIQFIYEPTLNKFQVQGAQVNVASPDNYFYLPAGYDDPNIVTAMATANQVASPLYLIFQQYPNLSDIFTPGYTLNLRLGFTWNGIYPNPYTNLISSNPTFYTQNLPFCFYWYLRKKDPSILLPPSWQTNLLTANNYADLVNTSCVKIYTDIALGSTEDSQGDAGLLSVVPVNASNLGVGFYQNNFNNPLTKIPKLISEIGIRLVNDQGAPYLLPNSATVLLELAATYY